MKTRRPFSGGQPPHCESDGFALILVLWGTALLAIVAGSFALTMRGETVRSSHQLESAQLAALAEAGVQLGIFELLKEDETLGSPTPASPHRVMLDGVELQISLTAENGKVDLNAVPENWVKTLVDVLASPDDLTLAAQLTDRILDWRDIDHERRAQGAEDFEYATEAADYGSRDGPFLAVEDLTQVLGIGHEMFEQLRPWVTVYTGHPQVDPRYAPREVLLSVKGIDPDQVRAFMSARSMAFEAGNGMPTLSATFSGGRLYLAERRANVFTVECTAMSLSGASGYARAVVVLTRNGSRPYEVISWSETRPLGPG